MNDKVKDSPTIHNLQLKGIIEKAAHKLSQDECFSLLERDIFANFSITVEECLFILDKIIPIVKNFNGNDEKFLSNFFKLMLPKQQIFSRLPVLHSNLLCSEMASLCLKLLIQPKDADQQGKEERLFSLSEKELHGLQYLAGYCCRTIYCRLRRPHSWRSIATQQSLAILMAAKCMEDDTQKLVNIRDRGALWRVNKKAQNIFMVCEQYFCTITSKSKTCIDSTLMVKQVMQDNIVQSNFKDICRSADIVVDKEVSKNLLECLVLLYVRVRTHSHAKSLKEKHKAAKQRTKQRSLRTGIKQSSSSTDMGH